MILTDRVAQVFKDPFLHYCADGLVTEESLKRLNSDLPERSIFTREVKEEAGRRKQYRMWRCEVGHNNMRTVQADRLPSAWSELVDSALSEEFRTWLSRTTGAVLDGLPATVGLYIFGDNDYSTIDTGKLEKALSVGLFVNNDWNPAYGGAWQAFSQKYPVASPAHTIYPFGGRCITYVPTRSSWHRVQQVTTSGKSERLVLMVEIWRVER